MTGTIGPDGFCTRCQQVADWCECPPLPDEAAQDDADRDYAEVARLQPEPSGPGGSEPMTELGYARRLVAAHGDRLRYVPAWRRWLVWDGARWAHDSTGQAQRWMKSIARVQTAWAMAITDVPPRSGRPGAVRPRPPWRAR
jgi:phage/plasmid-associated DNA primase